MTTVEGRARFLVNVRYPRDLRSDLETLARVLVMTPSGAQVPLAQVASIRTVTGPSMIRNESGLPVGYVFGRSSTTSAWACRLRTSPRPPARSSASPSKARVGACRPSGSDITVRRPEEGAVRP